LVRVMSVLKFGILLLVVRGVHASASPYATHGWTVDNKISDAAPSLFLGLHCINGTLNCFSYGGWGWGSRWGLGGFGGLNRHAHGLFGGKEFVV